MIDEDKYWEQSIAIGVFVFASYSFIKDYLNEPIYYSTRTSIAQLFVGSIFSPIITLTTAAFFLAIFMSFIIFLGVRYIISSIKKKEKINNYNSFWH